MKKLITVLALLMSFLSYGATLSCSVETEDGALFNKVETIVDVNEDPEFHYDIKDSNNRDQGFKLDVMTSGGNIDILVFTDKESGVGTTFTDVMGGETSASVNLLIDLSGYEVFCNIQK